jgi:hypothetical protein
MIPEPFIIANPCNTIFALIIAIIIFHIIFLVFFKLSKIGWKYVDYIWLSTAILGIFASSIEVRRQVASSQFETAKYLDHFKYGNLRERLQFLCSSAVCRQFKKSEYSPANIDQIQIEYNLVCEHARRLLQIIPIEAPDSLDTTLFVKRPVVTDPILKDQYLSLENAITEYNNAHKIFSKIKKFTQKSDIEYTLGLLGPFILAIALALRITKVSGELQLEKSA